MRRLFSNFAGNTDGATAIEYSVMLACIVVALLFGLTNVGREVTDLWSNNEQSIGEGLDG